MEKIKLLLVLVTLFIYTDIASQSCESEALYSIENLVKVKGVPLEDMPETGACIRLYVWVDSFTVSKFAGASPGIEAGQWVQNNFNNFRTLYEREGINVELWYDVNTTETWDTAQASTSDLGDFLNDFGDYLYDQQQSVGLDYHMYAVWTMKPFLGGLAWIDQLCQDFRPITVDGRPTHFGPNSISAQMTMNVEQISSVNTYSWNANIITHEAGHTIGSPHTHQCFWGPFDDSMDDCSSNFGLCNVWNPQECCTVMSYCHTDNRGIDLWNNGFGSEPGDLIRAKVLGADCLGCAFCDPSVITLTGNLSGTYSADTIYLENVTVDESNIVTFNCRFLIVEDGNEVDIFRNCDKIWTGCQ